MTQIKPHISAQKCRWQFSDHCAQGLKMIPGKKRGVGINNAVSSEKKNVNNVVIMLHRQIYNEYDV